ncbi:MAG: serine/threonine protein kinase [Labilithrix sp.]|nr:serine/threonine protein kinase [Labilithrix sp.]
MLLELPSPAPRGVDLSKDVSQPMVGRLPRSALLAHRYRRLGVIGRGATGTVHRARDRLNGRLVALKTLSSDLTDSAPPPDWTRSPPKPEVLEREFVLLAGLRHPNVIATLDYGRDDTLGPFFTMDLQDGACTLRAAAANQPLETKVDLLVQLLHALVYLHRRGLVHRDLKPENALCARGVLKLIDLGLASAIGRTDDIAGGTLAYAAPELVRGGPPTERSDLYAVGVIAYEILSGRVPFEASSPARLLQAVFLSAPNFAVPGIDPALVPVLSRLLERDPAARFADAIDVITALSNALGRPLALETTSTRESFLHGAGFVGRDTELDRLQRLLPLVQPDEATAATNDRANRRAILVAGESGAGKSRLLEELAVDAMVRGIHVLRGQALREGSRPYEPWRGVLRHLALLVEPGGLEAAVLSGVVPDLPALLGRDVSDATELDPEATHVRLMRAVEALLRRANQPILVMLEDLQWAGTESLKLFARIQVLAADLPLLLVASYRDDERPTLQRELPDTTTIHLDRLPADAIARLCASMLGERNVESAGATSDLVELVHRRSDGNAFLALEVMRTLANEAGGLERVITLPLAEKLLEDGTVERLVHRRVRRLSDGDRAFLQTAAVAGRELDLELLAKLHPDLDVEACATRAVEAAVLSSAQGRWWFAHDKLRDALIEALPDDARREIHRKLAHAILAKRPQHASTLAHHFGAAGARTHEKEFAALAGDQFLRSGAYHEAIPFLRRALALFGPSDPPLTRAVVERRLGEALFRSGQLLEARESLANALATLGCPLPATRPRMVQGLLREAWTQLRLRVRRRNVPPPVPSQVEWFEEAILAYTELSRLAHHLNDEELVLHVTLSALNLSERGMLHAHHARLTAVMGAVMGLLPVHRWARFYFAKAERISSRLDDANIQAFVRAHRGYYLAGIGEWRACEEDLERSRALYDRIGDVRLAEEAISILAYAQFFKGDLKRSLELYRALERSGEERVDGQIISWGLTNRTKVLVRSGRLAGVDDLMKRVDAVLVDGITRTVRDGVAIELELARGDLRTAREEAVSAAARLERSSPRSFMAVSTYAAIADVLLRCLDDSATEGPPHEARRLQRQATNANRALAKLARVFPIAEPARLLHQGTFEALRGHTARARSLWLRAARLASEREMPFEEALARAALARLDEEGRSTLVPPDTLRP